MKKILSFKITLFAIIILFAPLFCANAVDAGGALGSASLFLISPPAWVAVNAPSIVEATECSILNMHTCIFNAIIDVAFKMLVGTVTSFMEFAEKTLNYVINDAYQGLGFTASDNEYIAIGWGVVRNIANAILVLGLVAIAISIILGNDENKARRYLINFIIIALLINFTPVICGFIIDGANIITSSMLTGSSSSGYSTVIRNLLTDTIPHSNLSVESRFAFTFIVCLFCIFAIVIYFLYAILFLARTVILWILVMVSPLAFATFIIKDLPQSQYIRKIFPSVLFWDNWLESFIQWAVIGIPAGFSLFISNKILVEVGNNLGALTKSATGGEMVLTTLTVYLVPFIFMIAGFFITISAGTEAAKKLSPEMTGWAMKGLGVAGTAGAAMAGGAIGAGAGAAGGVKSWMQRDPNAQYAGNSLSDFALVGARTGWSKGQEAVKKEGALGATLSAGNRALGVGSGAAAGGGKWAIRSATGRGGDNLRESVIKGAEKGYEDKGVKTIARETGGAIVGAAGAVEGAMSGAEEAIKQKVAGTPNVSILGTAKREALRDAETGYNVGGTIAGTLGAKAADIAKRGAVEVSDTVYKKVVQPPKDKKKKEEEDED